MKTEKDRLSSDAEEQATFLNNGAGNLCDPDNYAQNTTVDQSVIQTTCQTEFQKANPSKDLSDLQVELPKVSFSIEETLKDEGHGDKLFQHKRQTARKSLSKDKMNESHLNDSEDLDLQIKSEVLPEDDGTRTSAKICNFTCPKCKGTIRYSPNDLQKHFQQLHSGELPSYPCEMCSFSSNDFQKFTQHRHTHRNTFVKCDICNDDQLYTLLDLTKHFTVKHSVNGNFRCEKCNVSTMDVGTFVQHIHRHGELQYKCVKCSFFCFNKGEFQQHLVGHTRIFPFSCQYCDYSSTRRDYVVKHVIALHREKLQAKDTLEKDNGQNKIVENPSAIKLVLKKTTTESSRMALRKRQQNGIGTAETAEINVQVLRNMNDVQCKSENPSQPLNECHVNEEKNANSSRGNENPNAQDGTSATTAQCSKQDDGSSSSLGLLRNAVHGPTVLMVKNNKISVPANYSAKFMGFKVVDGKQHIVIKLLPTNKQNSHLSESQSTALKDGSIDVLQNYTNRNVVYQQASLSANGHGTSHQAQQSNECCPTSTPFSVTNSSGKANSVKPNILSHVRNVDPSKSSATISAVKMISQMPVKPTSIANLSDLSMKTGGNATISSAAYVLQNNSLGLCINVASDAIKDSKHAPFHTEQNMLQKGNITHTGANEHNDLPSDCLFKGSSPLLSNSNISDNPTSSSSSTAKQKSDLLCSQSFSHEGYPLNGVASSMSHITNGRKMDSSLPSQSKISTSDEQMKTTDSCITPNINRSDSERLHLLRNGNSILGNQGLHTSREGSTTQELNCGSIISVPNFTSVFSLQNHQVSSFYSPENNHLFQNAVKVKLKAHQTLSCAAANQIQLTSGQQSGNILTGVKDSVTKSSLQSPVNVANQFTEREVTLKCNTTDAGKYVETQKKILTTLHGSQDGKLTKTTGIGTILKTHSDAIINQQLAKEKLGVTFNNPSGLGSLKILRPQTLPEGSRFLVASSPKGVLVPLHLSSQPGLHVVSGSTISSTNLSGVQISNGTSASVALNKRPGMVLTFAGGAFGAVGNITTGSSQVLGAVTRNDQVEQKGQNGNCSSASIFNQTTVSVVNQVSKMPLQGPLIVVNSTNPPMQGTTVSPQVKGLPAGLNILQYCAMQEHRVATTGTLVSGKLHHEAQQKPPIYALLPDGRRAVLVKYVAPTEHTQNYLQGNACNQNLQPKKIEGTQQKYFLKIVKTPSFQVPATCINQSVNTSVASLKLGGMQSLGSIAQVQRHAIYSSNALSGSLIQSTSSLPSPASTYIPPKESLQPTKRLRTLLQKCSSNSTQVDTCKRSGSSRQQAIWNRRKDNVSKNKYDPLRLDPNYCEPELGRRNRSLKRKSKEQFEELPRKRMLTRKCKGKNLTEEASESLYTYKPRASKDTMRTLRLRPFSLNQTVKCPRRNQPVVVLNHPDADFPEVVNVMKTITKFKGHVLKVSLSRRTSDALLHSAYSSTSEITTTECTAKNRKMFMPVSPVKERFVLKLTLKKTSKNNYTIVKSGSENVLKVKFSCWFCGRIFENQDDWVGHGQRHLMEATRDWNTLVY